MDSSASLSPSIMDDKPRLRPIEAFPVQQDGKTLIYLKDPLNFASPLGLSPVGYFILSHFDGRHSSVDIQEAYCKQFGSVLAGEELKSFVDMLDQHYYLQSKRFRDYRDAVILEFRRLPIRAAVHVGGAYDADRTAVASKDIFRAASHRRPAYRLSPRRAGVRMGLQISDGK